MSDTGRLDSRTERQLLVDAINRVQDVYLQLGPMIKALDDLGRILQAHAEELDDHRRRIGHLEDDVRNLKKAVGL